MEGVFWNVSFLWYLLGAYGEVLDIHRAKLRSLAFYVRILHTPKPRRLGLQIRKILATNRRL
jgi:hypothetical protein